MLHPTLLYPTLLYPTLLPLLMISVIRLITTSSEHNSQKQHFCLHQQTPTTVTRSRRPPRHLTHQDLTPFNYLIDDSTGRVQAVLDWDGALYLPVGSNFYFVESVFGLMTLSGWQDTEDRQELEGAFYDRALASLASQGVGVVTKEQLESQKAIGMLLYGVERLLKFKDKRAEHYLDGYLRGLSVMMYWPSIWTRPACVGVRLYSKRY
jgi:hypothetical protein